MDTLCILVDSLGVHMDNSRHRPLFFVPHVGGNIPAAAVVPTQKTEKSTSDGPVFYEVCNCRGAITLDGPQSA